MATIAVGADDAGAPLKERLAAYLRQRGFEVTDFGNGDGRDYPDVAAEVAEAVARGEHDPLKAWKLTKEDWRNRERRAAYEEAVEEMLERTDHPLARWQLVEAESKRYARVKVVETAVAEIERGMEARGFPPAARRPARR